MPVKRKRKNYQKDFDRFKNYIYKLWEEALQLIDSLPKSDSIVVSAFLSNYYREEKDHYWSLTKLFAHAMYIPMFLQIGEKHFNKLIYIDTHSGPGLARIGPADDEIVLGSPLIALRWPQIIAQNLSQYKKISSGFDKLYFIEKDPRRAKVLEKLVNKYNQEKKVVIKDEDSNLALPDIIKKELKHSSRPLFYIFIDPYGEISTQLKAYTIISSLGAARADTIITVFDSHIVRAFQGKPDPPRAKELFGKTFCKSQLKAAERLCRIGSPKREDIIEAYKHLLKQAGYRNIVTIPIQKEAITIYHLMLAVKDSTSPWIDAYVNYLRRMLPKPKVLRNTWKNITGKQKTLDEFF